MTCVYIKICAGNLKETNKTWGESIKGEGSEGTRICNMKLKGGDWKYIRTGGMEE